VLLRFSTPAPQALLDTSERLAADLDADFLWTVAGDDEIDFEALAADYHGRPPTAPEAASMARFLHDHPMYFYRRGRGRYQPAPKASLTAALPASKRKRREADKVRAWADELKAKTCPTRSAHSAGSCCTRRTRTRSNTRRCASRATS
jgi:exoribonuclease-2